MKNTNVYMTVIVFAPRDVGQLPYKFHKVSNLRNLHLWLNRYQPARYHYLNVYRGGRYMGRVYQDWHYLQVPVKM